jgi:hypothetical protein
MLQWCLFQLKCRPTPSMIWSRSLKLSDSRIGLRCIHHWCPNSTIPPTHSTNQPKNCSSAILVTPTFQRSSICISRLQCSSSDIKHWSKTDDHCNRPNEQRVFSPRIHWKFFVQFLVKEQYTFSMNNCLTNSIWKWFIFVNQINISIFSMISNGIFGNFALKHLHAVLDSLNYTHL